MKLVILVFGILILILGAMILLRPRTVFGYMGSHSESLGIHVLAVVVRVILGVALISYAAESRFPLTLEVLGWIALAAAVGLAVIGRTNFRRLLKWAMQLVDSYCRIAGAVAAVFGGFLIYAVR